MSRTQVRDEMFLIFMVKTTVSVSERVTSAGAAVAVTSISASVQGPVAPTTGNVNAEAVGDAVVGVGAIPVALGDGVDPLSLDVGAAVVLALPSGPLKAYQMIKVIMASPTRTTPRRRQ